MMQVAVTNNRPDLATRVAAAQMLTKVQPFRHKQAEETIAAVSPGVSLVARRAVQWVALIETAYGLGWGGAGKGSHNWGAIQAGPPPCTPGKSFPYTDTHSNGEKYDICFRAYPTNEAGAADLVRLLNKMPHVHKLLAEEHPTPRSMAVAMKKDHYYEASVNRYTLGLQSAQKDIEKELGKPGLNIDLSHLFWTGAAIAVGGVAVWRLGK